MLSLHSEILAHQLVEENEKGKGKDEKRRLSQESPEKMEKIDDGMVHEADDVQAAEPVRRGGLVRNEDGQVCRLVAVILRPLESPLIPSIPLPIQQHRFITKASAPRQSLLGLDRLAAEKRAQAASASPSGSSNGGAMGPPMKKQRTDADVDENGLLSGGGVFKGQYLAAEGLC